MIPTYGFGDLSTADKAVFSFYADRHPVGFEEVSTLFVALSASSACLPHQQGWSEQGDDPQVLRRYSEITPGIVLSGPTDFAPIINRVRIPCQHFRDSVDRRHSLLYAMLPAWATGSVPAIPTLPTATAARRVLVDTWRIRTANECVISARMLVRIACRQAIETVQQEREYHILVIIADGTLHPGCRPCGRYALAHVTTVGVFCCPPRLGSAVGVLHAAYSILRRCRGSHSTTAAWSWLPL